MTKEDYVANTKPVEILLVEDNPGDVRLTRESLKECKFVNKIYTVNDGVKAMEFLHRTGAYADMPKPDLIILDLNLPRMDGREVLEKIKEDSELKHIPVVILTSSKAEEDVLSAYQHHANCYITKPLLLDQFMTVVKSIESFWISIVQLPPQENDR